jgi:hypothetical protein
MFDLQAEAKQRADQNDPGKDSHAGQGRRDGNRSNDVGRDENFQTEQNGAADILAV